MSDDPRPNWYDDGHGQERWWDGRAWTKHVRAPGLAPQAAVAAPPTTTAPTVQLNTGPARAEPATPEATAAVRPSRSEKERAQRPPSARRKRHVLIPVVVGVLAFFLGIGIGAGTGGGGASSQAAATPSVDTRMQAALTAMTTSRDALQSKLDESAAAVSATADRESTLDAQQDELAALKKKLDKREKKLDARKAALASAEDSGSASSAGAGTSTTTFYANCDAVRAAGAAPITTGEPGYSRSLDRDGDGVGCE